MKRTCLALINIMLQGMLFSAYAQIPKNVIKGDKCFANYDYTQALSYYRKAVSSYPGDTAALSHLAACYYILHDYPNAEKYYAKAVAINGVSANTYYYYGEALKSNGKIDEAQEQFLTCSKLDPSDSSAVAEVKYCERLKKKFYIAYQVSKVNNINTSHAEFSPALINNELIFVSDRKSDVVNMDVNNATGGNPLKIFEAPTIGNGFGTPKEYPIKVNRTESHYNVGPITVSANGGNELFFTQVADVRKSNYVNQAKIYYCEKKGNSWSAPMPFAYNSDSYSVMDPCLSPDGQTLYFSSDMPGGYGKNDLYSCARQSDGTWSKPENLGSEVNTPGNEAFPYARKDGVLFFSSDHHFNYGGLDFFSTVLKNGKWTDVHNLGSDINSSADDFGICFNDDNRTGYFSSNREGGKGSDDIYSFLYIGDYRPLKGAVLLSYNINDPVPGIGVSLLEEGKVIGHTKTDSKGGFIFTKLDPDKKYEVKVDEADPRFIGKKKFYLADSTGKIVSTTVGDTMKDFVFKTLPPDLTTMPELDASDKNINLAGNLLQGDSSRPLANIKINMLNANGEIIGSAITNPFGAFVFTKLPQDENYQFKLADGTDSKFIPRTKVVLTDKSGNTLKTFYIGSDGSFNFQVLMSDTTTLTRMTVEDPELRLQLRNVLLSSDKKTPLRNVKLSMVDKNGNVLQTAITGTNGDFVFTNLPPDKTYMLEVDNNDPQLNKLDKLFIANNKNAELKEIDLAHGGFKYEMLPSDKKTMGDIYVYDPWIEALNLKNKKNRTDSMYIIENIYYDYQKWDILPAATHVLDKVVSVMNADPSITIELDAFTDPRGSDEFNMQLSQKRADAAVNYMVSHGIKANRVTGKGFGKTHPINNCGDPDAHCSDAEFALNRRTEFKIQRNSK